MSFGAAVKLATDRVVDPVEGMHRVISRRWFTALGPIGKPIQRIHDTVSSIVYGSIRIGAGIVGAVLDARSASGPEPAGVFERVVEGLWGGAERHSRRLDAATTVCGHRGDAVQLDSKFGSSFGSTEGRVVVLVHGLMETDSRWHGDGMQPSLLRMIENSPGLTPIAVRYNTALPVAVSGAQLASLLDRLEAIWPQPIESIALVGYSMGGLVARDACTAGSAAGHDWIEKVTDVITVGTPHCGAPLEKLVDLASRGLQASATTRPLADFLNTRSEGIKDLRHGWTGPNVNGLLPNAEFHAVGGVVTADPAHPIGALLGDLVVRPASSIRVPELDPSSVVLVGSTKHLDLIHEPEVVEHVVGWLARRPGIQSE